MSTIRWRWHPRTMPVYPDGDALSERELRILHQIERDMEMDFEGVTADGDPAPLQFFALYALMAEVALVLAACAAVVALTSFASTAWTLGVPNVRPPGGRL